MPETPDYDIVIIGAGIQGAGVAQAAAAEGYTTLVIEKFLQAGLGTSSKSSKLIHGGLRYLESGQLKLVKECLDERKRLLKNAPHLVKLIPFYIPVYTHSLRPNWLIWAGLCLYSLFSLKPFSIIKKSAWDMLDGINTKNLKTIFKYYDAQTDDKMLTQAVMNSAIKMGAVIKYNANFIESKTKKNIHILTYKNDKTNHNIKCKCIVNCTGPWVNITQKKISPPLTTPEIELIAGTHIVIDQPLERGAYYIEAKDHRAVFVMPWKNRHTLIGTTERPFDDLADNVAPTDTEIQYLLHTYNQYFNTQVNHKNIIDSFSGLRVLPASEQSVFHKSRESLIIHNSTSPALVTLIGGKLTAYRASSETVLLKIKKLIGESGKAKFSSTKNIPL